MSAPATDETAMRGKLEGPRSGRRRLARRLAGGVAAAVLAGALPAMASATDYCVDATPACGPKNVGSFEEALDQADNTNGADRIFLGATEYTAPTTSGYSYAALNAPVEIIGQGQGQTILTSQPGGRVLALAGGAGTSVHDLTVKLPQSAAAGTFGLLTYNTARRVEVVEASTQANYRYGAILENGGALEDSTVTLAGEQHAAGVLFQTGDGVVRRSTLSAGTGVLSYGGTIEGSRVTGSQYAVRAFDGPTAISSSLIRLAGSYGSALRLETATSPSATMTADGVTIVTPVSPDVVGAGVSTANSPTESANLILTNSIVRGSNPLFARTTGTGEAKVIVSYSDYDPSEDVTLGANASITQADVSNAGDAGFVDAAGGDYRLLPGSPLVDGGDPGTPQGMDLDGNPLVADGNGDGSARRDMGPSSSRQQRLAVAASRTAARASRQQTSRLRS